MKIELARGGPADGHVREIEGTPTRFFVYSSDPGKWQDVKPEVTHETHVYRDAVRFNENGNRVYEYAGKVWKV